VYQQKHREAVAMTMILTPEESLRWEEGSGWEAFKVEETIIERLIDLDITKPGTVWLDTGAVALRITPPGASQRGAARWNHIVHCAAASQRLFAWDMPRRWKAGERMLGTRGRSPRIPKRKATGGWRTRTASMWADREEPSDA
jgi:hypothetical protein